MQQVLKVSCLHRAIFGPWAVFRIVAVEVRALVRMNWDEACEKQMTVPASKYLIVIQEALGAIITVTIIHWWCFFSLRETLSLSILVAQNSFNLNIEASRIWICISFQRCLVHIGCDCIYSHPWLIWRKAVWVFCVNSSVYQLSYLKVMCFLCNKNKVAIIRIG